MKGLIELRLNLVIVPYLTCTVYDIRSGNDRQRRRPLTRRTCWWWRGKSQSFFGGTSKAKTNPKPVLLS